MKKGTSKQSNSSVGIEEQNIIGLNNLIQWSRIMCTISPLKNENMKENHLDLKVGSMTKQVMSN